LLGKDFRAPAPDGHTELHRLIQRAVFPGFQGTPDPAAIAAKARALAIASTTGFRDVMRVVLANAQALADEMASLGFRVLTKGTDSHMVLVDISASGLNGVSAERALEECGILANRNKIQGDSSAPTIGNGLRFGTNIIAQRGMGPTEVRECAQLIHHILSHTTLSDGGDYHLDIEIRDWARGRVSALCDRFPLQFEYGENN
jgi:glycine hydroxymethyltransferase